MAEVRVAITLNGQDVPAEDVAGTIEDLRSALTDVETQLTGEQAKVQWNWDDQADVLLAASPNGTPRETLEEIVLRVDQEIREARNADAPQHWAAGSRARTSILSILRRLATVDSITFRALDREILEIDDARLLDMRDRRHTYVETSALEGVIETISTRGGDLHFTLREYFTGRTINCAFSEDLLDAVKAAFGFGVTTTGSVRYRADGNATSMTVDEIEALPEPEMSLEEMAGSVPNLTGGIPAADYLRRIRGESDDG